MRKKYLLLLAVVLSTRFAAEASSMTKATLAADPTGNLWWTDQHTFQTAIINTSDLYRGQHSASLLSWNSTLKEFAAWYVNNHDCVFRHSGESFGENLAHGYSTPAVSVAAWGNERAQYNFDRPGFSSATGHFSQLVWKKTTDVGCASRWCGSQMQWLLACEYWPRGNVYGQFEDNFGRQVRWWAAKARRGLSLRERH